MNYPKLRTIQASRQMVDTFKGYNHNLRIGDGEFFDMENLTSDFYPVLSPRKARGVYASPSNPLGIIAKDALCYVDGSDFVINGYRINMGLNDEPKQLISMGAFVIIMPDRMWINTANWDGSTFNEDAGWGYIDAHFISASDVTFSLCTVDGADYENMTVSGDAPSAVNQALWIDTSTKPHTLKQYSSVNSVWVQIPTTYIKISSTGIGKAFEQYDGVSISGIVDASLQDLNASMVIWAKGDDYIVVTGILDAVITQTAGEGYVTVERKMPQMDFICESENRLWGCRYGVANNGEVVNEIYASKLGDFKNWNCFMGLATDSYAASCGTDGQFTGAVTHKGFPLFWKENFVHKVYGNYPANFQIQTTACRGVQKGCGKSLAIVNETLFYKARSGVMAYDGSLPTEVSYALGNEAYSGAVGGAHGDKYYISMKDSKGVARLFVFDTAKSMWHKEDDLRAAAFCSCDGEMYCIDADTGDIVTMLGTGNPYEEEVPWMAETGEIGLSSPDMKYISRITLRMTVEPGANVRIYAQYDFSDKWEQVCALSGSSLRSFSIPIRPKRCDHMRLRIEGEGPAKIYSITKTIEQGSELS